MSTWTKRRLDRCRLFVLVVSLGFVVPESRAASPAGRYTLTADTVVDTVTGLTWQRAVAPGTYTWASAKTYCTSLSLGGIGAGAWRLPRKLELESIIDFGAYQPAIDVVAFPATPVYYFWSSSPYVSLAGYAWVVYFNYGGSDGDSTTNSYSVRCVH